MIKNPGLNGWAKAIVTPSFDKAMARADIANENGWHVLIVKRGCWIWAYWTVWVS